MDIFIPKQDFEKDREWRPNKKQEPFLALPWSIKEGFYGGGAGSGKSDVLLMYGICHQLHLNPRFKQVFMRRTFPELRNEIVPRSKNIYHKFGATFNKSDMAWTFPRPDQFGGTGLSNDGAIIFLGHCETDDDVHKYDSMEINLFTPDELTSFTEWIYIYIGFQRTRSSDRSLPAIIRAAGMPGGIGHSWVKKRFVDPHPAGGIILEGRAGVTRIFIHATQADNPHIDPNYKQSLAAIPNEAERNAKLYGNFDAYLGQVFEEFRDRLYPDEPDNAVHVIEPFDIPHWWPRLFIGDWGFHAQSYVLSAAIAPTRRVYVYRERAWRKTKIEEWAPYIKRDLESENVKLVRFCQSTAQDHGQAHTIQQQISDALNFQVDLTKNTPGSRIAGKSLVHEYLRWRHKPVPAKEKLVYDEIHAAWLHRNKGDRAYQEYLELFSTPDPEDNLPKLQIFNTCTLLIGAIKACVYAKSKDGIPAEDVAEFDGDDPYDTLRYLVDSADIYFKESGDEFLRIQEREQLAHHLETTRDMTSFYRRAEQLDRVSRTRTVAVNRYHHGNIRAGGRGIR